MRRCLIFIGQPLGVIHKHLIDIVYLERGEDIVLVIDTILIARQGDIALRGEGQVMDRELLRQILLGRE